MSKRLLGLTRYSNLGASSRLRISAYRDALCDAGIDLILNPFWSDKDLSSFYKTGRHSLGLSISAYLRRLTGVLTRGDFDGILLEKDLMPYVPLALEPKLDLPIIIDIDDAVFHNYDLHKSWFVRKLLSDKFPHLFANANAILAGSPYLVEIANRYAPGKVYLIPTSVNTNVYRVKRYATPPANITVGWIGSPSTVRYFDDLIDLIGSDLKSRNISLTIIGAQSKHAFVKAVKWTAESEVDLITTFDIGIMPLTDTPWERGKCAYKLIQYMACGIPVIASPVGANISVVRNGINGFLAKTKDEWLQSIDTLAYSMAARKQMGEAGRVLVEKYYSTSKVSTDVAQIIRSFL